MEELQKAFFVLLHAVAANELSSVIIALDAGVLDKLLQALLANAASHSEAGIRRACFQVPAVNSLFYLLNVRGARVSLTAVCACSIVLWPEMGVTEFSG